jgi:hypothetical protein
MQTQQEQNETRVYNLTAELINTKQQKKDSNAAFNDEIKRLQSEINEIIRDANAAGDGNIVTANES